MTEKSLFSSVLKNYENLGLSMWQNQQQKRDDTDITVLCFESMASYDSGKYKDIQLRVIVTYGEWEHGFAFSDM